jgi:hypothetical protein
MVRIADCTNAQFLALIVLLASALRSVLVQASGDFEIIYSPALPRCDDYLPLLVRGGSLDPVYENITVADEVFRAVASITNYDSTRAASLYQSQHLLKPYHSMRRRMPDQQRLRKIDASHDHKPGLSYTEIMQCKSPNGIGPGNAEQSDFPGDRYYGDNLFTSKEYSNSRGGKMEGTQKLSHSPVVYQYYGRSRMRGNPSQSVQFIVIGPNVDHWKAVGQILASRGFDTIACERIQDDKADRSKDSPNLVLDILDALKWNRAVLVGCDREAILAMETAMMLAPDRVAGMVLCGDLEEASRVASEAGVDVLDSFCRRILDCPFLIVWDGDSPSLVSGSSAHDAIASDSDSTCQILGGGRAPHRTKAEQFAWVLTSFVEEKLEVTSQKLHRFGREERRKPSVSNQRQNDSRNLFRLINLPFGVNTLVSPEGRLLLGRAMAAAIFYITVMKVAVIQYGILRAGLIGLKSKYDSVDAVVKRIFHVIGAFILNYGYIPRLFSVKKAAEDDDDGSETSVVLSPQRQARPEEARPEEARPEEMLDGEGPVIEEEPEETTDSTPNETSDESESGDDDSNQEISLPEENELRRFKPFFFLDSVVT